jgi:hypothetical protein
MIRGFVKRLFGIAPAPEAEPAVPPPPGTLRLHLFHGTFETERAALAYCFDAPGPDQPEPFTNDLPEAFVDTDFVEVSYGDDRQSALTDYFHSDLAEDLLERQEGSNTLVIVVEEAFGGFPFRVHDTPRLTYMGPFDADLTKRGK